jgi:ABC-type transporter Mla subunit MlaD
VLTSPWKIGFFVSLMLVFVSIGVAYYFTRTFSLSWGINAFEPSLRWLNNEVWTPMMNGKGFLVQIAPLIALVGVTALLSFIVIAQAVRKYKRYLDSGLDYKNLLSSLQEIDDFEERGQIEKLRNHPELKTFLVRIRDRMADRTRELNEREKALENRVQSAEQKKEEELTKRFGFECERLVDAIQRGIGDLPDELGLTMIEAQRVEEALRQRSQVDGEESSGLSKRDYQAPFNDLRRTSATMQKRIAEVANELAEGRQGAKQIESQLTELSASNPANGETIDVAEVEKQMRAIRNSTKTMDTLATTLGLLGEEAKGIAINTALQAGSGRATQKDMVQLAEDLKAIAARFTDLSKSYLGVTGKVQGANNQLRAQWSQLAPQVDPSTSSVESIASKMSLWVERIVVLSDKVTNLKEAYDRELESVPDVDKDSDSPMGSGFGNPSDLFQVEDYGFQTADRGSSIFSEKAELGSDIPGIEKDSRGVFQEISSEDEGLFADLTAEEAVPPEEPTLIDGDSFRGRNTIDELDQKGTSLADMLDQEAPPSADTLEQRATSLAEMLEQEAPPSADMLEQEAPPSADTLEQEAPPSADTPEQEAPPSADMPEQEAPPSTDMLDEETRSSVPPPVDLSGFQVESNGLAARHDDRPASTLAAEDIEEDVMDLYAIGAIDYDPAVHS